MNKFKLNPKFIKRVFVSFIACIELTTSVVYAAEVDFNLNTDASNVVETSILDIENSSDRPEEITTKSDVDIVDHVKPTGSTSITAMDLLGDNPSINISVPNNAVTQQATTESATTVETELIQRDLVYNRKDVIITATGLLPKDATLELLESNKITDLVQYNGDTENRKLYDTLFNYNIKINNKGIDYVPTESIKWVFESPLIKATTPDGKNLSLDFVKVLGKEKVKNTEVEKLEKINSTIQEGKIEFSAKELGDYALVATLKDEIKLVNKTITAMLKEGSKITITGLMPEDSEIEAFVVEKPSLNTKTLDDGSQIVEVYKTYDIKMKSDSYGYYQPKDYGKTVKVTIDSKDIKPQTTTKESTLTEQNETVLLHTDDKGNTDEVDTANIKKGNVSFTADSFSEFSLAGTKSIGNYIVFSSDDSFTLKTYKGTKNWDGRIEYSINNGSTWTIWDGKLLTIAKGKSLYMRGRNNTYITGTAYSTSWKFTGKYCNGNIENLLDYETVQNGGHPEMATACFRYMFSGCTSLEQAPDLLAITVSPECCLQMFNGCTNLKYAPELSATTLAKNCYDDMFRDCYKLETAPELPATTLADKCYDYMFWNCKSLEQAPALPATTLARDCYYGMFNGCTSLKQGPELPAIALAESCYKGMFYNCVALAQAPALSATTMAKYCYENMFYGCKSLESVPELPATTLAEECYSSMFCGCTSLEQAPVLPAKTTKNYCYSCMFSRCTNLKQAPELPATTLAENCYYCMFSGCKSLEHAPELPATTLAESCYMQMFESCISLCSIPALPATELKPHCYENMFNCCRQFKLSSYQNMYYTIEYNLPSGLDGNMNSVVDDALRHMFNDTTGNVITPTFNKTYYLTDRVPEISNITSATKDNAFVISSTSAFTLKTRNTAKAWNGFIFYSLDNANTWVEWDGTLINIPANKELLLVGKDNTSVSTYSSSWKLEGTDIRFSGNIENLLDFEVVRKGEEPVMAKECYAYMFSGCIGLETAPELPATTLSPFCYAYMFSGCTNLKQAPELSATELADHCYDSMFSGCASLEQAPELPAIELADYCYDSMFYGCASLEQAPELPANELADYCYEYMFCNCTNLKQIPQFTIKKVACACCYSMFDRCSSLEQVPMVLSCMDLHTPHIEETINEGEYIGPFTSMFSYCENLKQAPDLPASILEYSCYSYMFYECTSLEQAPALPAKTTKDYCYSRMFSGCTNLKQVPELPATTIAYYCYEGMFDGCENLKVSETSDDEYSYEYRIPSKGVIVEPNETDENYENYYDGFYSDSLYDMFESTGGTFTGTPEINTTYYLTNPPIKALTCAYYVSLPASLLLDSNDGDGVYSSDFTVKAKSTEFGLDNHLIKVVPSVMTTLTNEKDNTTVTLNITQNKNYFGEIDSNTMVEKVTANEWSEIDGSVSANIQNQGKYKGNFEFEYGLISSCITTGEHVPTAAIKENNIEPTCTHGGSYDNVVYCEICNSELSRKHITTESVADNHHFVHDVCTECNAFNYPEVGTSLDRMSFTQIQRIAQEGKTAEYNIQVGDYVSITYNVKAEIIAIGPDYIDFMTKDYIYFSGSTTSTLKTGETITSYGDSYYQYPQVNYEGKGNSAEISYVNSDIKKRIDTWLNSRSDEFKMSLKEVSREYEVATLTYVDRFYGINNYKQQITGTVTDIEKVYLPTKAELEGICKDATCYHYLSVLTATPFPFSPSANDNCVKGWFYQGSNGEICSYGTSGTFVYLLFRIG